MQDIDWPGVYQDRWRSPIGPTSDISPLDQGIAPTGTDFLSPYEYFGKQRTADIGKNVYLIPHNVNGSSFGSTGWGVGNARHEEFITRANASIARILAVEPTAVVKGLIQFECSNDANAGTTPLTYETALLAAIADMRSRIFMNGVSGTTIAATLYIANGMLPEYLSNANRLGYEQVLRRLPLNVTNGKFYKMPEGIHRGDNLHPNLAGSRTVGAANANLLTDTTGPVVAGVVGTGAHACYESQKMLLPLEANEYAWFTLSGAGAADYEITIISDGVSGINLSRFKQYLRWNGDGTKAPGSYPVTINAYDGAGNLTSFTFTTVVSAAYGSVVEAISATTLTQFDGATTNDARSRPNVPVSLGAGMNMIIINRNAGSAPGLTSVTFNGIEATPDPNNSAPTWVYYLPLPTAQTGTLIITQSSSTITNATVEVICLRGTVATPASSSVKPNAQRAAAAHLTDSLTCPASGIIVGGGKIAGLSTGTAGQTTIQNSGTMFTARRTTDGVLGHTGTNSGFSFLAAAAFAKA